MPTDCSIFNKFLPILNTSPKLVPSILAFNTAIPKSVGNLLKFNCTSADRFDIPDNIASVVPTNPVTFSSSATYPTVCAKISSVPAAPSVAVAANLANPCTDSAPIPKFSRKYFPVVSNCLPNLFIVPVA